MRSRRALGSELVAGHLRRLLPVAALTALLALPAAVAASSSVPTLTPGVLAVAVRLGAPRFQSGRTQGGRVLRAQGLEIELAQRLAEKLGVSLELRYLPRSAGLLSPGPKPWDVALDRIPQQAALAAGLPALPYLRALQAVLPRRGLAQPLRTQADLRWLRLCAARGSAGARLITSVVRPLDRPILTRTQTELPDLLAAGSCDAAVADAPVLAAARELAPGRYGQLAGSLGGGARRYALVLPQGSPLAPALRAALRSLEREQAVRALSRKWLGVDVQRLPALSPRPEPVTVTLIGDSVSASLDYEATARSLLARGLNLRFESMACRRLAAPGCGQPPPPTALQTIVGDGRALGQIAVIDIGYNDSSSGYAAGLDTAMRDLLRNGVRHVIWVTLRERYSDYHTINQIIRAAQRRWPELSVADWNACSEGKPWFASDGIHLNAAGTLGLALFLRPFLAPLASG